MQDLKHIGRTAIGLSLIGSASPPSATLTHSFDAREVPMRASVPIKQAAGRALQERFRGPHLQVLIEGRLERVPCQDLLSTVGPVHLLTAIEILPNYIGRHLDWRQILRAPISSVALDSIRATAQQIDSGCIGES